MSYSSPLPYGRKKGGGEERRVGRRTRGGSTFFMATALLSVIVSQDPIKRKRAALQFLGAKSMTWKRKGGLSKLHMIRKKKKGRNVRANRGSRGKVACALNVSMERDDGGKEASGYRGKRRRKKEGEERRSSKPAQTTTSALLSLARLKKKNSAENFRPAKFRGKKKKRKVASLLIEKGERKITTFWLTSVTGKEKETIVVLSRPQGEEGGGEGKAV